MSTKTAILLVNFGGPRNLGEIGSFLTELLTDVDVIRTPLPRFFDRWFFRRVALRRVGKVAKDYELIGGKSPLFEDTEQVAVELRDRTGLPVITFHRYLPETHNRFFNDVAAMDAEKFVILPMYPQFSYSTTGSIARFFSENFPDEIVRKMEWVRSYPAHAPYIKSMQNCIRDFLVSQMIQEEEAFLFFSAHGLPQKYVDRGDTYQNECRITYDAIMKAFPKTLSLLAFQSKFGPGEWLRPYTSELSADPSAWSCGRKHIVFVPLSFTSDHLETLYEVEYMYVKNIREKGLAAYRCPALNHRIDWMDALASLVKEAKTPNRALIKN